LGGGQERNLNKWEANEHLYSIALKAVRTEKDDRYQSIDEYFAAWNKALLEAVALSTGQPR
jgi:serine/threonine protein kinase, bacterial